MKNTLILAFFFSLACIASPAFPEDGNDKEALRLYQSLFKNSAKRSASATHDHTCATYPINTLRSYVARKNVSESVRRITSRATNPNGPALPLELESEHFTVKYTQGDPDDSHNVPPEMITPFIPAMEAYYKKYLKAFGEIQNSINKKIIVEIYSFDDLEEKLQDANGFTTYGNTPIVINAKHLRFGTKCDIEDTLAHELFHRVQFAHGMYSVAGSSEDPFFVEGLAQWGAFFSDPTHGTLIDFVNTYFSNPASEAFGARGYQIAHFWLYLDERFQEFAGKKASGRVIDSILNEYKKGKTKKSAYGILKKSLAALLEVEDEKFRTKPTYKTSPANRFIQEWHLTNGLKDLNIKNKKLTYSSFITTDTCGKKHDIYPTAITDGSSIDNNESDFSAARTLLPGTVHYYNFSVAGGVTDIKIATKGTGGIITTSVVGLLGSKQKILKEGAKDSNSFQLKFKAGTIDFMQIAISVPVDSKQTSYTLKINDDEAGGIDGVWIDTALGGQVTISQTKNTINGSYNDNGDPLMGNRNATITGNRDGNEVTIFVTRVGSTSPDLSYNLEICPSGEVMIGKIKSIPPSGFDEGFMVWCRNSSSNACQTELCGGLKD